MHEVCPTEVDFMSVVIDYCTPTIAVHHSFWGGTHWNFMYVLPHFNGGYFSEKTFRSFQDVILLTYSKVFSPSRTTIGSTKCDHLY